MERVLIIEPGANGHRLMYVREIAERAISTGRRPVWVTTEVAWQSQERRVFLNSLGEELDVEVVSDLRLRAVERLARRVGAVRTVLPDGDRWLPKVVGHFGWRGPGDLRILVMRPDAQPTPHWWDGRFRHRAKRSLMAAAGAFPSIRVFELRSPFWNGEDRFEVARDPVSISPNLPSRQEVLRRFDLDAHTAWFAIFGVIGFRKNVRAVVEALCSAAPEETGLLLAGRIDPEVLRDAAPMLERFKGLGGTVRVINRLLSEEELDGAVSAVDCLMIVQDTEAPSGLLGKAVCLGTRSIVAGAHSLAADCEQLAGSALTCGTEVGEIAGGVRLALSMRQTAGAVRRAMPNSFGRTLIG